MGDWIMTSSWLTTLGADYGVQAGKHVAKIALAEQAPSIIYDSDIGDFLDARIAAGTLPPPSDPDTIYMLYFPASTAIYFDTAQGGGQSCQDFGGYHTSWVHAGKPVAYGVIPDCPAWGDELENIEHGMSHELIEAASNADPLSTPAAYAMNFYNTNPPNGWLFLGGENADLCNNEAGYDGAYYVTSAWSNTQAAKGNVDPCLPSRGPSPYFNVSPEAQGFKYAKAGETVTFQLTGWSEGPVLDWYLSTQSISGTFDAKPILAASKLNNGQTTTLTLKVPAIAQQGDYAVALVYSAKSQTSYSIWPVAVLVY
jgi:hypothetical protein